MTLTTVISLLNEPTGNEDDYDFWNFIPDCPLIHSEHTFKRVVEGDVTTQQPWKGPVQLLHAGKDKDSLNILVLAISELDPGKYIRIGL